VFLLSDLFINTVLGQFIRIDSVFILGYQNCLVKQGKIAGEACLFGDLIQVNKGFILEIRG
jgi:hypothetical protein